MKNTLILITGLSASGKTTIGTALAEHLKLPFLSRDTFKELLFDSLGWSDREWSKKLGTSSYAVFYHVAELLLKAHVSCVLESNFKRDSDSAKVHDLQQRYGFRVVQIVCKADGPVLFERFKERAASGHRHPGHVDTQNEEEFRNFFLTNRAEPLAIEGEVIELDTNTFTNIDIASLAKKVCG